MHRTRIVLQFFMRNMSDIIFYKRRPKVAHKQQSESGRARNLHCCIVACLLRLQTLHSFSCVFASLVKSRHIFAGQKGAFKFDVRVISTKFTIHVSAYSLNFFILYDLTSSILSKSKQYFFRLAICTFFWKFVTSMLLSERNLRHASSHKLICGKGNLNRHFFSSKVPQDVDNIFLHLAEITQSFRRLSARWGWP